MTKKRIDIIDALRGLAVILMVAHHLLYDLVEFLGAPAWLFENPIFNLLHYIFAGLFIFLSGLSSRFSRSNVKRGVKLFFIAVAITVVTTFLDMPIRFGVLHLLAFCMVFYGMTTKLWDALPRAYAPIIYIALLVISAIAVNKIDINANILWMFGWTYPGFSSADYFPIFPWMFVFLLGTWAGVYVTEQKLPQWFYEKKVRFLPKVGKRALVIYVVHQPVLYGITMGIKHLFSN